MSGARARAPAAIGVFLAAAMAGAAVAVAFALHTGFDRATARADLPDVLVRFDADRRSEVDAIIRRLPNVRSRAYRFEVGDVRLAGGSDSSARGAVTFVEPHRRGYAVVSGRDVDGRPNEAVVDRGVARAWGLEVGDPISVGRLGTLRIAGVAVSPDNVAFPLASVPRVYVDERWLERGAGGTFPVNRALVWANDRRDVDVLLQQARATSTEIRDVRFLTRSGVRVLLDQAGGIVVALLVAFSLVALGAAGTMLAAGASADVQRRLQTIGVQRAIGFSRAQIAAQYGGRAALVGLLAGAAGLAAGALAASGPASDLLLALNEQPPGWAVLAPLLAALAAIVVLVAAAAAWPAWRATARAPVALLRGAELAGARPRRLALGGSFAALGARLALVRLGRAAATVAVLAASAAVILLMLGLASLVAALRDDPGSVGKRYDLTARLGADRAGRSARSPASPTLRRAGSFAARTLSRSASRSSSSRSPATTRASRTRRSRAGAGWRPTTRPRSASGSRRRSGSGPGERSPSSCPRAARRASASSG